MNLELVLYTTVILLILILIVLGVLVYNYRKIEGYFTILKFRIVNRYLVSANSQKDTFKFTIYNAALNDARLSSFGYTYLQKSIDFYQDYLKVQNLPLHHEEMIVSRGSFSFSVDIERLADLIQDINLGSYRVKPISLYAISSLGQMTRIQSNLVTKHLRIILGRRYRIVKKRLRVIKLEQRRLKREQFNQKFAHGMTQLKTKWRKLTKPNKK
jgi:hypothetical protein